MAEMDVKRNYASEWSVVARLGRIFYFHSPDSIETAHQTSASAIAALKGFLYLLKNISKTAPKADQQRVQAKPMKARKMMKKSIVAKVL